jgi:predicted Rossmann fold nucleotide-binding protein DprA/Smf involved in DNA uptake
MNLSDTTKASLAAAKAKRGKTPPALLEHQKTTIRLQRQLLEALATERTIPELAEATGLDAAVVFFQVNAMRKYGKVEDSGKRGDYLCYRATGG